MSGFTPRSALFVPGHRTDMLAKVDRTRPDAVIVDWEGRCAGGGQGGGT